MTFRGSPLTRIFDPSASPFDISFPSNTSPTFGLNAGTPVALPEVFRNRSGFLQGTMRFNPSGDPGELTYLFYGTDDAGNIADQIGSWRAFYGASTAPSTPWTSSCGFWVFLQNRFAGIRIDVDIAGPGAAPDFDFQGAIQVV
jgi:hypothetical protein